MYFPITINWTSPFPILWLLGDIFHFYSYFKETSVGKQWRTWSDAALSSGFALCYHGHFARKPVFVLSWQFYEKTCPWAIMVICEKNCHRANMTILGETLSLGFHGHLWDNLFRLLWPFCEKTCHALSWSFGRKHAIGYHGHFARNPAFVLSWPFEGNPAIGQSWPFAGNPVFGLLRPFGRKPAFMLSWPFVRKPAIGLSWPFPWNPAFGVSWVFDQEIPKLVKATTETS